MRIAVLSRSSSLYSTYRLLVAGKRLGHNMRVIDHVGCRLTLEENKPEVYFGREHLNNVDAIIPRIGASVTFYGAAVIQQFEMKGVYTVTPSESLLQARNKLRSLQLLSMAGIGMPKSSFAHFNMEAKDVLAVHEDKELIVKLLEGTQGIGVVLAEDKSQAESIMAAFNRLRKRFLVQEFIKESKGSDIRAFVVGDKVVASMKRQAVGDEFRSNLHRGGFGTEVQLSEEERETALKAASILKLKVAGVDILRSNRGPLLLEVNPSPGLEGIEKTTGVDIASKIINLVAKEANK